MSDGTASIARNRVRTWGILLALFLGLLLASVASVWFYLRYDGDVQAVENEAEALGIRVRAQAESRPSSSSVRLAEARRIDAAVAAIKYGNDGRYFAWRSGIAPTAEFRKSHQAISSSVVREIAQAIVALGGDPLVRAPRDRGIYLRNWGTLLNNRILIAGADELQDCVLANRTRVELMLGERDRWWAGNDLLEFCLAVMHRIPDQRAGLLPLADWLQAMADTLVSDFPVILEERLSAEFLDIRSGERFIKERGIRLSAWLATTELAIDIAVRVEREDILRAKVDWLQFVKAHPAQLRAWMDEAERRSVMRAARGSWLGQTTHDEMLYEQHPVILRQRAEHVLQARALAAELRGSPWPIDVFDRMGRPLRRWEKGGRLIGAYSVGPDGVDDGGHVSKDITLRLFPEPAAPGP